MDPIQLFRPDVFAALMEKVAAEGLGATSPPRGGGRTLTVGDPVTLGGAYAPRFVTRDREPSVPPPPKDKAQFVAGRNPAAGVGESATVQTGRYGLGAPKFAPLRASVERPMSIPPPADEPRPGFARR